MQDDSILFLCAHNDDQIVGAGGTLAKYAKEGKKIITMIFSFGEISLLHMKEDIARKTRINESKRAGKLLGEYEIHYLGLRENNFKKEIDEREVQKDIIKVIKKYKPSRIFTHSDDDPHPDHKEVCRFTKELIEEINYKGEVYTYNVWNFFINYKKRDSPKLVVDITDTFNLKVEALKKHKSQLLAIIGLMWNIYFQAIFYGFNNRMKYAEVFYKLQ